ncbi:MAG TPA: phosphoribosylformylglycinamidine synthase subunit PurL [Candidatus Dormibacteraeota bacterium]|nr:phosphoribosylformylglycinamidine synthase subunit PurL [Candidatus Dormibacteraeota bacterium]
MIDVALHGDERRRIAEALGREPTRVELYAFDAQWSEHCSYKSSRAQLRRLPASGERVVLGPGEDAGILHLGEHEGERYAVVAAHESHNHPSQVVPFEGAATGVGGIVRDVLCMGAQLIGIADALRFGDVATPGTHQRHVAQAVVDGISAYGNAIGVPNLTGDVFFHEGFNENCLVNVIALGLVKESQIVHSFAPPGSEGWPLVLVGKATDASGFGGASFSSLALDAENDAANRGAVQVPDPFLKNVLMRATYRVFALLRERGIAAACKDLGAGGVMGCSAEICASGGYGARIDLDRINVAQANLPPEVLAVGETQERMLFILPPDVVADVLRVYNEEFSLPEIAYDARAVVIGSVTKEPRYVLRHNGQTVMDVDIELLTKPLELAVARGEYTSAQRLEPPPRVAAFLSSLDGCSREPLYSRYDAVVRGCTVLPRGYGDAGVVAPIPGSSLGVAVAVAGNPRYGVVDPRLAAECAVLEAVRKVVAVGARPIGLTDCLNFGNPTNPEHYAEFVAAVDGLERAARSLGLPFVSGNVSFYNESSAGKAVPASAIVACIGAIEDVARTVTPALKRAGSALCFAQDLDEVLHAMQEGQVLACRAITGGDACAAAVEMAFASARAGSALGVCMPDGIAGVDRGGFLMETTTPFGERVGSVLDEPAIVFGKTRWNVRAVHDAWMRPLAEIYA